MNYSTYCISVGWSGYMQVRRVEPKPNDCSNAGMIFVKLYEHCRSYLNILDRGVFFLSLVLTFTTFWVNSADDKLEISIPPKKQDLHSMQIVNYSQTSMARTSLGPWKFVRNMGSSSHWGLIMTPLQEANSDNLGKSFRFSTQWLYVECTH